MFKKEIGWERTEGANVEIGKSENVKMRELRREKTGGLGDLGTGGAEPRSSLTTMMNRFKSFPGGEKYW